MSERDEMRDDKIRQYMEDDARTRVEKENGVRFEFYDGYLEDVEIEDPEEFLANHECDLLVQLQDENDDDIEMILAYCYLARKKARQAEDQKKAKEMGTVPRIPKVENICLESDQDDFLKDLVLGD